LQLLQKSWSDSQARLRNALSGHPRVKVTTQENQLACLPKHPTSQACTFERRAYTNWLSAYNTSIHDKNGHFSNTPPATGKECVSFAAANVVEEFGLPPAWATLLLLTAFALACLRPKRRCN